MEVGVKVIVRTRQDARVFDMFDSFLLAQHPILPIASPVLHSSQDDFGHFQPRVPQSHYNVVMNGMSI